MKDSSVVTSSDFSWLLNARLKCCYLSVLFVSCATSLMDDFQIRREQNVCCQWCIDKNVCK